MNIDFVYKWMYNGVEREREREREYVEQGNIAPRQME